MRPNGGGNLERTQLAVGNGWAVSDVACACGPGDRPFEEQHGGMTIAIVQSGSFEYRSSAGGGLMTPGSLLLGNAKQCFECSHQHAAGDHCLSFHYEPGYFHEVLHARTFPSGRVPPNAKTSRLTGTIRLHACNWEELSVTICGLATEMARADEQRVSDAATVRRVTRIVRAMESEPGSAFSLLEMARSALLSPYHFLRAFKAATGTTPHQLLLRMRLQHAAKKLATTDLSVLEIALQCGFGDLSNFNRQFRREFLISPTAYRRANSSRSF